MYLFNIANETRCMFYTKMNNKPWTCTKLPTLFCNTKLYMNPLYDNFTCSITYIYANIDINNICFKPKR